MINGTTDDTSDHVRRCVRGDRESLAWVADRFMPLVLSHARHRVRGLLAHVTTPEDIAAETWLVVLSRIPALELRNERATPSVVKFMGRVLLLKVRSTLDTHLRRAALVDAVPGAPIPSVSRMSASLTSVLSCVIRSETSRHVLRAVQHLSRPDRELFVLRGIERLSVAEVGELLGMSPNHAAVKYWRIIEQVKRAVPGSIFDHLEEG